MFYVEDSDFGEFPNNCSFSKGIGDSEEGNIVKQTHLYGTEDWGESVGVNSFYSDLGFSQDNPTEEGTTKCQQPQPRLLSEVFSPAFEFSPDDGVKLAGIHSEYLEVLEPKKENPQFSSASLEILKNYGSMFRRLNVEKILAPNHESRTEVSRQKLSTIAILRLAGENFIQSCSQGVVDDLSTLTHPFAASFLGLSDEETKDVELVQFLLASAEKIGLQQFDRASKLLSLCYDLSSDNGNSIQRLVHYFSETLLKKIDHATGRVGQKGLGHKQLVDVDAVRLHPAIIAIHENVPFSQVCQFTAIQSIVENVAEVRKVHVIDLEICSGMQCTVLMHALAARRDCPLEHLKITAVGTKTKSKSTIEETGKRLISFAESMKLPFSFNAVMVADMLDLSRDLFDLDPEESVAIYSTYMLKSMIAWPERLDCLMRLIRSISPCVMVVIEVEGNHNSPVFVNRFIETLFYYGAYFDSLEDCMHHDETNRKVLESQYLSPAIRNILAAEGEERMIRHVTINVWRAFFARFGMSETEFSKPSLYQANILLKNFACGSSCALEMDGKCLIIGWKGTPLYSLSAWKFL